MSAGVQTGEVGKTAWLSEGFEELLHRGELDYGVIIVGSGYGGAIAAAELAGCTKKGADGKEEPVTVCVLERGREYLAGMFPSRLADLAGHVRFSTEASLLPRGRREGLFDIRIGPDVNAVVGNGLGGGSLINAGVMERPDTAMLRTWPAAVAAELDHYLGEAESLLDVHSGFDPGRGGEPQKLKAFQALDPGVRAARMTIKLDGGRNREDVAVDPCKRCGDCATGCNHGAKNSLDVSLLARAWRADAKIFTGATVLRIERGAGGAWVLHVAHTDEQLRKRQGKPAKLRARKVVLSAGTFGSTEILMRSQSDGLRFSPKLGQQFSSNGDAIAVLYDQGDPVNAVADENVDPDRPNEPGRGVGPTITGVLDLRDRVSGKGVVVEEIAVPGPLRRVFEETVTTSKILHELGDPDTSDHGGDDAQHDPCAVNADEISGTSIFVMMGDDGARGALELVNGASEADDTEAGDGAVRVRWPDLRDHPVLQEQIDSLQQAACRSGRAARVLPNPAWQLMPTSMQFLFDDKRGPALTVHPLGGCPMGDNAFEGVVSHLGQVFDLAADGSGLQPLDDLVVLDGSIVPGALGINPALTISALALRAARELRQVWGFGPRRDGKALPERSRFQHLPGQPARKATEIKVVERMRGEAILDFPGEGRRRCLVELTLHFAQRDLAALVLPANGPHVPLRREFKVDWGRARVFFKEDWDRWSKDAGKEGDLDQLAVVSIPVVSGGTLAFLHREKSTPQERERRGYDAYWRNRGRRDSWQEAVRRWREGSLLESYRELWGRRARAKNLATRAGEVRLLEYELELGEPQWPSGPPGSRGAFKANAPLRGRKRLTYEERCNPWRQLMEMELREFPGLVRDEKAVLELDLKYLARERVPLVKIVAQNDQVAALADVGSFAGYLLRLLINIHMWSFRRPDTPVLREPQRLPGGIPGRLPEPSVREIELDRLPNGMPVVVRLTRYKPNDARGRPIVMIHGYSASGTTFAHHAVKPNMAEHFFGKKRDVWVLDLRTSSGMPTARHPWTFEDAALADLPAAIDAICRETKCETVDVFAHCMGAAMFSMAVLAPPQSGEPFFRERDDFPRRIHRAVLSQIAPVVVMSPANVFRGYVMSYLRHFLPFANYEFRVRPDPSLTDQLIDRLLATLPYPEEEFAVENPPWFWRTTPFVGTRHRMDALYGRDFSLADKQGNALLSGEVLEYIDDLFGPLNIDTVAQGIHFAHGELVTDRAGRNRYALPLNIQRRWRFPTLSIHGEENGLSDVSTLGRFQARFRDELGADVEVCRFPGFGHQDSLIGKNARQVFEKVSRFLAAK